MSREWGVGLDDTISSWSMVSLIFLFMFTIGVAIANFPWVLMGQKKEITTTITITNTITNIITLTTPLTITITITITTPR